MSYFTRCSNILVVTKNKMTVISRGVATFVLQQVKCSNQVKVGFTRLRKSRTFLQFSGLAGPVKITMVNDYTMNLVGFSLLYG